MKVLSIDAWGNAEEGFDWNESFNVGTIDKTDFELLKTDDDYIKWFYDNGFTTSVTGASIEDDGNYIVICDETTGEPIFAIEYGSEY